MAFGAAQPLIAADQIIAARQTFLEVYERECATARSAFRPPKWTPSLGHDKRQRAAAVETAQRLGRITAQHAAILLPAPENATITALLDAPRSAMPDDVRRQLASFTAKLRVKPCKGSKP